MHGAEVGYPSNVNFRELVSYLCSPIIEKAKIGSLSRLDLIDSFIICYRKYATADIFFAEISHSIENNFKTVGYLSLLRLWLMKYFQRDFCSRRRKRLKLLLSLLEKLSMVKGPADIIFEVNMVKLAIIRQYSRIKIPPLSPTLSRPNKSFFSFSIREIAEQLTQLEFNMFQQIPLEEFANVKNGKSKRLAAMVERSNRLSSWVASNILAQKDVYHQTQIVQRFVMIAYHCQMLNNFNSAMAIVNSLSFHFIYRLRKMWEIDSDHGLLLSKLRHVLSHTNNYKNYRQLLKKRKDMLKNGIPTLPYIGVFSRDLALIEEGNQDFEALSSPKKKEMVSTIGGQKINTEKLMLISNILQEIRPFQLVNYSSKIKEKNSPLLYHLTTLKSWPEARLIKRSEELRPPKPTEEEEEQNSSDCNSSEANVDFEPRPQSEQSFSHSDFVDLSNAESENL